MNTRNLLEVCIRLRNLDEFKPFRDWLKQTLDTELELLVKAGDDATIHRLQGSVRRVQLILELIEDSARVLDKGR